MIDRAGFSLNKKGNTNLIDGLSLFDLNFTRSSVNAVRDLCLDRYQQLTPEIGMKRPFNLKFKYDKPE